MNEPADMTSVLSQKNHYCHYHYDDHNHFQNTGDVSGGLADSVLADHKLRNSFRYTLDQNGYNVGYHNPAFSTRYVSQAYDQSAVLHVKYYLGSIVAETRLRQQKVTMAAEEKTLG